MCPWKLGYVDAGSVLVQVDSIAVEGGPQQGAPAPLATRSEQPLKPPVSGEMKGIYLQLGAFSAQANAETFRTRVARDLAWLTEPIQLRLLDGLYKLHLGPYRSQDDARRVAERIRAEFEVAPVLLQR